MLNPLYQCFLTVEPLSKLPVNPSDLIEVRPFPLSLKSGLICKSVFVMSQRALRLFQVR